MTRMPEGGIREASVPPAATTPAAKPGVIAVAQHFWDSDAAEHGSCCCRCAGHGGERCGREHRRDGQGRLADAAEPHAHAVERALGQPGVERHVPDQDEHRQHTESE